MAISLAVEPVGLGLPEAVERLALSRGLVDEGRNTGVGVCREEGGGAELCCVLCLPIPLVLRQARKRPPAPRTRIEQPERRKVEGFVEDHGL